jgi:hypothetical protein
MAKVTIRARRAVPPATSRVCRGLSSTRPAAGARRWMTGSRTVTRCGARAIPGIAPFIREANANIRRLRRGVAR